MFPYSASVGVGRTVREFCTCDDGGSGGGSGGGGGSAWPRPPVIRGTATITQGGILGICRTAQHDKLVGVCGDPKRGKRLHAFVTRVKRQRAVDGAHMEWTLGFTVLHVETLWRKSVVLFLARPRDGRRLRLHTV